MVFKMLSSKILMEPVFSAPSVFMISGQCMTCSATACKVAAAVATHWYMGSLAISHWYDRCMWKYRQHDGDRNDIFGSDNGGFRL